MRATATAATIDLSPVCIRVRPGEGPARAGDTVVFSTHDWENGETRFKGIVANVFGNGRLKVICSPTECYSVPADAAHVIRRGDA